jgi:hypothetical protein
MWALTPNPFRNNALGFASRVLFYARSCFTTLVSHDHFGSIRIVGRSTKISAVPAGAARVARATQREILRSSLPWRTSQQAN